ncbi:MAG: ABC-type transport system involved in cytochrome bd biosynthesis fused ATPase/permease subunit [Candidatus Poriferisodalaceae bacterium]|jgi:ATP-binding cassette, subfamily B, bacterial
MFFDSRLWALTKGARGVVAKSVAIGVLASVTGILRLGLLGWLLAKVFTGEPVSELVGPIVAVGGVMFARGALEHWRKILAHQTAAKMQLVLRSQPHAQGMHLGPAHFGDTRTGEVLLSLVEGVEQLEVWFGEYLPQQFVAALTRS